MTTLGYALGAWERRRWGGTAPSIQDWMVLPAVHDAHRTDYRLLRLAQMSRRWLTVGVVVTTIGIGVIVASLLI